MKVFAAIQLLFVGFGYAIANDSQEQQNKAQDPIQVPT
jgi:hypothetical protein